MSTNTMERISNLEKQLNKANNYRQQAITKKELYGQQKKDIEQQLENLGIKDVAKVDDEIKNIDNEIEKLLEEIQSELPMEILEKYSK